MENYNNNTNKDINNNQINNIKDKQLESITEEFTENFNDLKKLFITFISKYAKLLVHRNKSCELFLKNDKNTLEDGLAKCKFNPKNINNTIYASVCLSHKNKVEEISIKLREISFDINKIIILMYYDKKSFVHSKFDNTFILLLVICEFFEKMINDVLYFTYILENNILPLNKNNFLDNKGMIQNVVNEIIKNNNMKAAEQYIIDWACNNNIKLNGTDVTKQIKKELNKIKNVKENLKELLIEHHNDFLKILEKHINK